MGLSPETLGSDNGFLLNRPPRTQSMTGRRGKEKQRPPLSLLLIPPSSWVPGKQVPWAPSHPQPCSLGFLGLSELLVAPQDPPQKPPPPGSLPWSCPLCPISMNCLCLLLPPGVPGTSGFRVPVAVAFLSSTMAPPCDNCFLSNNRYLGLDLPVTHLTGWSSSQSCESSPPEQRRCPKSAG